MEGKNRIYAVNGNLTEEELLTIGTLLLRGGYTVKKTKQKLGGKDVKCIEYCVNTEAEH